MGSGNIDLPAILNRALEFAAQNLRVEKLLIQLGLDPTNVTYDAVFNRLVDVAIANINFANMLALTGAIFYVATLMVRTIVPLRVIGIISIGDVLKSRLEEKTAENAVLMDIARWPRAA